MSYDKTGAVIPDGQPKITYDYDAFGNEINPDPNDNNPFRYCGEYYDNESGMIYLKARYYAPGIGRFISEDPAKNGVNWYVYCAGNPVMFVDPLGLFDYNTRLSYSQTYNDDVKVLQKALVDRGYLDMSDGKGWGHFGSKTLAAVNAYKDDPKQGLGNKGKDAGVVGLQTWTSLGLTYRTKDDIAAGVTIATMGYNQYKNVSVPFDSALYNAGKAGEANKWRSWTWFYNTVKSGARWDIKNSNSWEETIGSTFPGRGVKVLYYGSLMTPEDLGNYAYGYIGASTGFSLDVLLQGSWTAADTSTLEKEENEIYDEAFITRGYDRY